MVIRSKTGRNCSCKSCAEKQPMCCYFQLFPFLTGEVSLGSLCVQQRRRRGVVNRQFYYTLGSLKARVIAFWRRNSEIKRAAIVKAVVIIFNVPRLQWPAEGPLFKPACFRKFQISDPNRQILNITLLPRKSEKRCKKETS